LLCPFGVLCSSTNGVGKTEHQCRRLKLDPCISPCTKINSKWVKAFHATPETLKILEENIGKVLQDIHIGYDFLNRTPIVQEIRARNNKSKKLHQIKKFWYSEGIYYQSEEKTYKMGENLCQLLI
jgi:hypothetical protein